MEHVGLGRGVWYTGGGKSRSSGEMTMQAGCTSAGIDAGDLRWDGQCGAAVGWQADDM